MGRIFKGLSLGMTLAVLVAAPAAAGSTESRSFERGYRASGGQAICRSGPESKTRCTDFWIEVFEGHRGGTDPAGRFRGHEVIVHKSTEVIDQGTGEVLRSRLLYGEARNGAALRVRFDGIRSATVSGTMEVRDIRCDRSGRCDRSRRPMALKLTWTPKAQPASSAFIYYRMNDGGCEITFSQTLRMRAARVAGELDGSGVRGRAELTKSDLLTTEVCRGG